MYLFVSLKMTLKWHVELGAPRRHVDVDEHLKLTSCRYIIIYLLLSTTQRVTRAPSSGHTPTHGEKYCR